MDVRKRAMNMARFSDISQVINNILGSLEKAILDMNRDQMYEDGVMDVNNPGAIVHYAPSTIKNKKKRAAFTRTDHITLKWDNNFHPSLKIDFKEDEFTIYSDNKVWKAYLQPQDRFSNALGLTEESLGLLRDWVRDKMIKQFKNV
jgi:hypothetical protein